MRDDLSPVSASGSCANSITIAGEVSRLAIRNLGPFVLPTAVESDWTPNAMWQWTSCPIGSPAQRVTRPQGLVGRRRGESDSVNADSVWKHGGDSPLSVMPVHPTEFLSESAATSYPEAAVGQQLQLPQITCTRFGNGLSTVIRFLIETNLHRIERA